MSCEIKEAPVAMTDRNGCKNDADSSTSSGVVEVRGVIDRMVVDDVDKLYSAGKI